MGCAFVHIDTYVSVQFSPSVMSDSLWPHGLQHTRPPCPSPTPRVYPNPCPLCQWCHPTISSSVVPFPSCPQSFPASWSFQVSQLSICVYIQRNITLPLKGWNTAISVTWIDPEIIIPNELIRKRKRNIIWYHLHIEFKKKY